MYVKNDALEGTKFGRWTVVSLAVFGTRKAWHCVCECGTERVVLNQTLKNGKSKSCGCLQKELLRERSITHGNCSKKYYNNFAEMMDRCFNPNNESYAYYGGAGITVLDDMNSYEGFISVMGDKPNTTEKWSVGRLDNSLPYTASNVRWENKYQQARNKTKFSSNVSGITGVFLVCETQKNGVDYERWVAKYMSLDGKQVKKSFSVLKYGNDLAKELAIKFREEGMKMLQENGADYGTKHGLERGA